MIMKNLLLVLDDSIVLEKELFGVKVCSEILKELRSGVDEIVL